jgi:hypothetical protein
MMKDVSNPGALAKVTDGMMLIVRPEPSSTDI